MIYKDKMRRIIIAIITVTFFVGSLLIPIEAKADDYYDVKIYSSRSSLDAAQDDEVRYLINSSGEDRALSDGQSIDVAAHSWILVDLNPSYGSSSALTQFDEGTAENHCEDWHYGTSGNMYYNVYDCPIRATRAGKKIQFEALEAPQSESVSTSSHTHAWTYGIIYEPTEDADGLEGETCSCGACRNTSVVPAVCAVIQNKYRQIDQARPGKDTILEMKNNCNFSQAFMKRLAAKNDCSFILRFTYEHKHYEVYIPAGTTFDTGLEWYGPKKIMEMFEWKQLY